VTALDDSTSPRTVIDALLEEQQRLTAVERFSQRHDRGTVPTQARYYRDLIPQSKPAPGQQYAFAVDLDACTGCKACVAACHSLNGLDEEETWRSVGLIHGGTTAKPYQQTVTTACHHCVEPGCLEGCPVMAYEKDTETGIVRHLDDQCIGCQYCVLKCPYDVPKYSERLGIVRKCDMCIDRLGAGEAPACVQACPTSAIRIELVDKQEVSKLAAPGSEMLPGAFDSNYTKPTTRYHTERGLPAGALPADHADLRLDHAHWPLIAMLLLTQTSAGLSVFLVYKLAFGTTASAHAPLAAFAWITLQMGLGVSVLHLGRPLGAWRFFLGLRTSWMSREILAFSIYAAASTATVACAWIPMLRDLLPVAALGTAALGLVSVFTSAMIYIDTRRPFWAARLTGPKFFGTTLLLGTTFAAAGLAVIDALGLAELTSAATTAAVVATMIRTALFLWERSTYQHALVSATDPAHRSARTIATLLPWLPKVRLTLFVISTVTGVLAIAGGFSFQVVFAVLAAVSTFSSHVLERYTFFTAAASPRMPGGVPA
jgi:Fe-S-cluster-containing dehydrogenase component/DMSO reductase anchor subunit